jgi:hypothetical protein
MKTIRYCRFADKKIKVFHGPSVAAGNSTTLNKHLNQLGIPSILVAYEDHKYLYGADVLLWDKGHGQLRRELTRVFSVLRVALGYEVIHFNFGTTMAMPSLPLSWKSTTLRYVLLREIHYFYSEFLQIFEVFLLVLLKRRVVITYQGDDARQGDISKTIFSESIAHHVGSDYYNRRTDRIKRRRVRRLSWLAHSVFYVNPDLSHFLPESATFIPYGHTNVMGMAPKFVPPRRRRVKILHAPSHQSAKGTSEITSKIIDLKNSGLPIDFYLIENVSHEELGSLLLDTDLLVDQLFAGWYGGIAVEALCRGVAVMSYLRHSDFLVIPTKMSDQLPIIPIDIGSISEQIEWFVNLSDEQVSDLRLRSIQYAEQWHNPESIARQYAKHYF